MTDKNHTPPPPQAGAKPQLTPEQQIMDKLKRGEFKIQSGPPTQARPHDVLVRLECAKVIFMHGSENQKNNFETAAERLYNFAIGTPGPEKTPAPAPAKS